MCTIRAFLLIALFGVVLGLTSCKEATLSPELSGNIEGQVLDFQTSAPIPNVGITTSPPNGAIVTDGEGKFHMEGVPTGNYTIAASKYGYKASTATVSVRENRTAQAVLFLRADTASTGNSGEGISVELVNWSARVLDRDNTIDSASVHVEYRVRNLSSAEIPSYEVYFRLKGPGDLVMFHEDGGSNLGKGQLDLRAFDKNTPGMRVQDVQIYDYWYTGKE